MAEVMSVDQDYGDDKSSTGTVGGSEVEISRAGSVSGTVGSSGEGIGKIKKVQMRVDEFKGVRVVKGGPGDEEETHSRRKSSRVVIKRKAESDEEESGDAKGKKRKKKAVNNEGDGGGKDSVVVVVGDKKGTASVAAVNVDGPTTQIAEQGKDVKKPQKPQNPKKKVIKVSKKSKSTVIGKKDIKSHGSKKGSSKPGVKSSKNKAASNGKNTKVKLKSATSVEKVAAPPVHEPQLNNEAWSACVPLLSSELKNNTPAVSRLKYPHMKPAPFAKDLIMFMNFINKFNQFLPTELWGISIQDLQVGLDLYPSNGTDDIQFSFYQDILPPRELKHCQDLVNLFSLCLMKLTLNHNSTTNMSSLTNGKPFTKLIQELRPKAVEFGYPPEWRQQDPPDELFMKPQSSLFDEDDSEPVDDKNSEILTANIHHWYHRLPLSPEENPLYTPEFEKFGILSLSPPNRLIMLRCLVQWCLSYSDKIHGEIYRLSHFKKDPTFGIQTYHVPRHLAHGIAETKQHFKKLCTLMMRKLEIRSSKKHIKKQLEIGKQQQLSVKLKLLQEIKDSIAEYKREYEAQKAAEGDSGKEDKKFDPMDVSLTRDYAKWCELLQGEVYDNPMTNPYNDEIYKLRNQEYFIGRVPHIGDFYLPRLFTYQNSLKKKDWIPSNYVDPGQLEQLFEDFQNNKYNVVNLFGKNAKMMSLQFKLYYHYTPGMVKDILSGKHTKDKVYWYEMCHDSQTLQDFIKLLEFKLVKEPNEEGSSSDNPEAAKESMIQQQKEFPGYNINPLPRESKYNKSRAKLQILRYYLEKMYYFLLRFEQLKMQYGDLITTDRNLRRSQRSRVNYTEEYHDDIYEQDDYEPAEDIPEGEIEYDDEIGDFSDDDQGATANGRRRSKRIHKSGFMSIKSTESRAVRSARRRADKM
ncbi:WHIM1 domain-containing protein Ecym_2325 [Eremothecium cymbalariae DBVPG|uniref:WHIM1 domain-containing protein n=1 Tax=Eremothecium cymbalariae (strain CBS 270.75 / DBVPG 7215 / KCTC 17166 / NRRL Y-17582) TaxID=931890 RepID=G8JQ62_ERECY|nr:Hypothetical protein Ecym_2325 [Eremothecium cymbalariae DBVPG\